MPPLQEVPTLPEGRLVRYYAIVPQSKHFREMLRRKDGTRHYLRLIEEFGDRWLRVVVNVRANPPTGVTVFFHRRLHGEKP